MNSAVVELRADLSIRADADNLREASHWLEQACCMRAVPADQIFRLDLCLNEAMANVISHGGESASATPVLLSLDVKSGNSDAEATLTIADAGLPFNPLTATDKVQPHSLAEAEPGGLGLTMISSFSDEIGYRFHQGKNQLTLTVRWPQAHL